MTSSCQCGGIISPISKKLRILQQNSLFIFVLWFTISLRYKKQDLIRLLIDLLLFVSKHVVMNIEWNISEIPRNWSKQTILCSVKQFINLSAFHFTDMMDAAEKSQLPHLFGHLRHCILIWTPPSSQKKGPAKPNSPPGLCICSSAVDSSQRSQCKCLCLRDDVSHRASVQHRVWFHV